MNCLAFVHLVKSAGTTVKLTLREAEKLSLFDFPHTNDSQYCLSYCEGRFGDCASKLYHRTCFAYAGTNVQLLRPMLAHRNCMWFTMVRDPFALLVSSLHYCRTHSDQLCGTKKGVDGRAFAHTATLREWAHYRSSPLFWTLMLDPQLHHRFMKPLLKSNPNIASIAHDGNPVWEAQATWYRLINYEDTRKFVTKLASQISNGTIMQTMGLTEQWEMSMRLFDRMIPLKGKTWMEFSKPFKRTHESYVYKETEETDILTARRDPVIWKIIEFDILLYDACMKLFKRLLVERLSDIQRPLKRITPLQLERTHDDNVNFHINWVDVRPMSPLSNTLQRELKIFATKYPFMMQHTTLWTSTDTQIDNLHENVAIKFLPTGMNGYIGKAYALLHSPHLINVFFDSDVRICDGYIKDVINPWITSGIDILWTYAYWPFGGYANYSSTSFVSSDLTLVTQEYKQFGERNTGTVLGVRRSKETNAWLSTAISIYSSLKSRGIIKYADQPAFRESYFLHRESLTEFLLSPTIGCRQESRIPAEKCVCETQCKFYHSKKNISC